MRGDEEEEGEGRGSGVQDPEEGPLFDLFLLPFFYSNTVTAKFLIPNTLTFSLSLSQNAVKSVS